MHMQPPNSCLHSVPGSTGSSLPSEHQLKAAPTWDTCPQVGDKSKELVLLLRLYCPVSYSCSTHCFVIISSILQKRKWRLKEVSSLGQDTESGRGAARFTPKELAFKRPFSLSGNFQGWHEGLLRKGPSDCPGSLPPTWSVGLWHLSLLGQAQRKRAIKATPHCPCLSLGAG